VPRPYGPDGPVKEVIHHTRPITEGGDWDELLYYEIWEQEYGALGGPPFPSPTPYALVGTNYTFGQRVEVWPLHVTVDARPSTIVESEGIADASQQLYLVDIAWHNPTSSALPIDYSRVQLRGVIDPRGALISDGRWGITARALQIAAIGTLPDSIPPGESRVTIPILAPPGTPEVVAVTFTADPSFQPDLPQPTDSTGATATTQLPTFTPTPPGNPALRAPGEQTITVLWSNASWRPPGAPPCGDAGALTDWQSDDAWGMPVPIVGVAAPPGAERLVQLALNQVGKRYVWGAKGPETFDCSGLVSWAYAQIGITIPQGTAGQWPGLRPVAASQALPGDLVFFDIEGRGRVDHVGMLAGDLDGDGGMDMVHAANPSLGVRVDYDFAASPYYAPRIRGYRTAR
jgi:cell wall-associated NlpC family hydrolase